MRDTSHLADYFVDNTPTLAEEPKFTLPDSIKRLFNIFFALEITRPNFEERGMYHAHAAALRSSCLARQVGAAILDSGGNLLSVGTNRGASLWREGAYDGSEDKDCRCFAAQAACSNLEPQNKIFSDVVQRLRSDGLLRGDATPEKVIGAIRGTRIKSLIEFCRAVHAEMDAIMSLARAGTRLPKEATLFTTTYPCHNCARHIVGAGISRLVYLEPYAKSMAITLHSDSIADNLPPEKSKGLVQFVPYEGVSPRLYHRVYLKTADFKTHWADLFHLHTRGKPLPHYGPRRIQILKRRLWHLLTSLRLHRRPLRRCKP